MMNIPPIDDFLSIYKVNGVNSLLACIFRKSESLQLSEMDSNGIELLFCMHHLRPNSALKIYINCQSQFSIAFEK